MIINNNNNIELSIEILYLFYILNKFINIKIYIILIIKNNNLYLILNNSIINLFFIIIKIVLHIITYQAIRIFNYKYLHTELK